MKSKPTTTVKKRSRPSESPSGKLSWKPHAYQLKAVQFLLEHAAAGLFLDPGLGKTSITIAATKILRGADMFLGGLVVAPLRVAVSTWAAELEKWADFDGMTVGLLHPETAKKSMEAVLNEGHHLYVINYEGLVKLFSRRRVGKVWKYELTPLGKLLMTKVDTLIWDELSKMKNSASLRYALIKPHIKKFARRWGLTGSPASNGLEDLFGQCYVLDEGRSLGQFITHYRAAYFTPVDKMGYTWKLKAGAEESIYERLRPLVLRMDAEDYLALPSELSHMIKLDLPPAVRKTYEELEEDMLTIVQDELITAPNAAAAISKCRQVCAGAIYTPDIDPITGIPRNGRGGKRPWALLHDTKIEALKDLVEELQGQQLLVAYEFHHDLERLLKAFPGTPSIGGGVSTKRGKEIEDAWNAGELPLLFGHPASMAHGLNLQGSHACHIAHFSPTWDFELYDQLNRRLRRQGNDAQHIHLYHFVVRNSVEESVVYSLRRKFKTQKALLDALKTKKGRD